MQVTEAEENVIMLCSPKSPKPSISSTIAHFVVLEVVGTAMRI